MKTSLFFPYSWHVDETEEEITCIRVYGITNDQRNICLRIDNFTPYIYIELPHYIKWTRSKAQLVGNKIDQLLNSKKPLKKSLVMKKRLYGVYIDEKTKKRKLFPYLFCSFSNKKDIKTLESCLRRRTFHIVGLGALKLKVHESDADPVLQLTCCRNIPTAGWVKFSGKEVPDINKLTTCDHEFKVKWKSLSPHECNTIPMPKIMGFDIEVNSTNPTTMCKAERPGDKVFQISCVITTKEGGDPSHYKKFLHTLGNPSEKIVGSDVVIFKYITEASLLEGFTEFINVENPNIIVGYNIFGFDIPYLIARAKMNMCMFNFDKQGFHKYAHAGEKKIKWSSSAYKNQEFEYLDAEGRLYVDLMPIVKRDYKFDNYKLKTVSERFIGATKDPLSPKGIFKCYKLGIKRDTNGKYSPEARKAMGIVGKYCVQDSNLVVLLMDKLKTWVGLSEMAKTCNVPIFSLYTQGQQIKVFSQVYKYCMYNNIIVEKDGYKSANDERYVGAKVFPPIPGRYEMVVPFDFASLYPTTIIAYNIDYHTWVPPGSDISDTKCHVMDWEDHIGCVHDPKIIRKMELTQYIEKQREKIKTMREKRNKSLNKLRRKEIMDDITNELEALKPYTAERAEISKTEPKIPMCAKRRYRFLKEPRGVMPTIIQRLLDARHHTRKVDIVECQNKIKKIEKGSGDKNLIDIQKSLIDVLNKRQLAYKVSANSMYGAMGVNRGYLPFMPGAMCTTYMGRVNIKVVADIIPKKFGGELVYGDTDSNYIHFPKLKTPQETWDHAIKVATEVTKLFPKPIQLEFEEEIYTFFFILSKKRYMYRKCLRDGIIEDKIGKKGVLLARRDSSKFVKNIYENVISKIADNESCDTILYYIITEINEMCASLKPYTDFVITKSVGDMNDLNPQTAIDEQGNKKTKIGDYIVPRLADDAQEREKQLLNKKAKNIKDFYLLSLPAQVQLAERMRRRGQRVDVGTRLEYVVTKPDQHTEKQYNKIEDAEYFRKHQCLLKLDYLYYLKALVNPLDQMLDVAFKDDEYFKPGFVMKQYKYRWKIRAKLLNELKKMFAPNLQFI